MRSPDMEMFELSTPHFMEYYEYLPDSAGAGEWRGGLGTTSSWRFYGRGELGVYDRRRRRQRGRRPGAGPLRRRAGRAQRARAALPGRHGEELGLEGDRARHPAGTVCVARNGGGGGYGDPHERDPRKVLAEVRDGLLSVEKARASYGVAVLADLAGDRRGRDGARCRRGAAA